MMFIWHATLKRDRDSSCVSIHRRGGIISPGTIFCIFLHDPDSKDRYRLDIDTLDTSPSGSISNRYLIDIDFRVFAIWGIRFHVYIYTTIFTPSSHHDDVIWWKHFPRYWSFVRGIYPSTVDSPHKGQWRGALLSSLMSAPEPTGEQTIEKSVIWDAFILIMTSL